MTSGAIGGGEGTYLKLDDPFLGKAQVHALRVLQVEGTLVELGDGVVGIQQCRLLVHLTNDLNKNRERGGYKLTGGTGATQYAVFDQLYASFLWYASSLYQSGQGHSSDRADQFDCLAIVDVTVSHSKFLSF